MKTLIKMDYIHQCSASHRTHYTSEKNFGIVLSEKDFKEYLTGWIAFIQ
jgi:hypothetical protein